MRIASDFYIAEGDGYKLETAFEHYTHRAKATEKRWRDAVISWQMYEEEIMVRWRDENAFVL